MNISQEQISKEIKMITAFLIEKLKKIEIVELKVNTSTEERHYHGTIRFSDNSNSLNYFNATWVRFDKKEIDFFIEGNNLRDALGILRDSTLE